MFRKILCPLDLSDFSRLAFEHGLVLAKWYGAEVVALHVFASWVPPGKLTTYPGWMRHVPEARDQIDAELGEQLQPAVRAGMDVPLVTREGDPVNEILEQAKSMRADLIVLATHGRSGFDRLALGSVAEKVLRKADCPVLMVPVEPIVEVGRKGEPPPFEGYRRIVCAMDFSEHSREALKFAISVASHGGGSVTLVHVVEVADEPEVGVEADTPVARLRRQRMETARYSLTQLAGQHASGGCSLETVVRLGKAHREILDVAARTDADLVVMGVRGRGAIDLTFFGSTTNQVVRLARCAVLTVRT